MFRSSSGGSAAASSSDEVGGGDAAAALASGGGADASSSSPIIQAVAAAAGPADAAAASGPQWKDAAVNGVPVQRLLHIHENLGCQLTEGQVCGIARDIYAVALYLRTMFRVDDTLPAPMHVCVARASFTATMMRPQSSTFALAIAMLLIRPSIDMVEACLRAQKVIGSIMAYYNGSSRIIIDPLGCPFVRAGEDPAEAENAGKIKVFWERASADYGHQVQGRQ